MGVSAAGLDEEARKYLAWRATKMIIPNASKTGREHSSIQSGEGSSAIWHAAQCEMESRNAPLL